MKEHTKKSLETTFATLEFLPNRTPDMSINGGTEKAFAELAQYRDGAIFVGYYSGTSEWERHISGEEIVMALEGSTTLLLLQDNGIAKVTLYASELTVVPKGVWHKFENSLNLKVMTITPQPTDHSTEQPSISKNNGN